MTVINDTLESTCSTHKLDTLDELLALIQPHQRELCYFALALKQSPELLSHPLLTHFMSRTIMLGTREEQKCIQSILTKAVNGDLPCTSQPTPYLN